MCMNYSCNCNDNTGLSLDQTIEQSFFVNSRGSTVVAEEIGRGKELKSVQKIGGKNQLCFNFKQKVWCWMDG